MNRFTGVAMEILSSLQKKRCDHSWSLDNSRMIFCCTMCDARVPKRSLMFVVTDWKKPLKPVLDSLVEA